MFSKRKRTKLFPQIFRLGNVEGCIGYRHVDQDSTHSSEASMLSDIAKMCRATSCVSHFFPVCVCRVLSVPVLIYMTNTCDYRYWSTNPVLSTTNIWARQLHGIFQHCGKSELQIVWASSRQGMYAKKILRKSEKKIVDDVITIIITIYKPWTRAFGTDSRLAGGSAPGPLSQH